MTDKAIEQFYTLKAIYEKKVASSKKRIIQSNLSIREKQKRLQKLKYNCVGCDRSVGTSFSEKDGHLMAKCGDTSQPCKLNIDIERGSFLFIHTLMNDLHVDLENNKISIMKLKLNLLFGLSKEEDIVEKFEKLKGTFKEYDKILSMLNSKLEGNNTMAVEEMGEEKVMQKSENIKIKKIQLGEHIAAFRELIHKYMGDSNITQSKKPIMGEAINIYIESIVPLSRIIRDITYEISTIVEKPPLFTLIEIKTKLENLQIEISPPKVISNVIK